MCGAGLSRDLRGSTYCVQGDERKILGQDPEPRPGDGHDVAGKHRAVANTPRRDSLELPSPPRFDPRSAHAIPKSSVLFETTHRLPAMFQVSVSYVRRH